MHVAAAADAYLEPVTKLDDRDVSFIEARVRDVVVLSGDSYST